MKRLRDSISFKSIRLMTMNDFRFTKWPCECEMESIPEENAHETYIYRNVNQINKSKLADTHFPTHF